MMPGCGGTFVRRTIEGFMNSTVDTGLLMSPQPHSLRLHEETELKNIRTIICVFINSLWVLTESDQKVFYVTAHEKLGVWKREHDVYHGNNQHHPRSNPIVL